MDSKTRRHFAEALRSNGAGFSVSRAPARAGRFTPGRPVGGRFAPEGAAARGVVLAAALVVCAVALCAEACLAHEPLDVPLHRISREHRNEVRSILENPTIVRRLPGRAFRADSATYVYLLDDLPLSSRLADLLNFGSYRVERMEDGRLHGWDFSGIEGDFWLVYAAPRVRIYRGIGSYDSWFTPKIAGRVLLVVEFRRIPAADPESEPGAMETKLDVYVSTNRLVGFLMEVMGQVTDKKLSQLVRIAQLTSEKLSREPHEVWAKMSASSLFTAEELESLRRRMPK